MKKIMVAFVFGIVGLSQMVVAPPSSAWECQEDGTQTVVIKGNNKIYFFDCTEDAGWVSGCIVTSN